MLTKNRSKHKRSSSSCNTNKINDASISFNRSNSNYNHYTSIYSKALETANLLKNDTFGYFLCEVVFCGVSMVIYLWIVFYTDFGPSTLSEPRFNSLLNFSVQKTPKPQPNLPIFQLYLLLHISCICFSLLSYYMTSIKYLELNRVINDEIDQSEIDFHKKFKNLSKIKRCAMRISDWFYGIYEDGSNGSNNNNNIITVSYSHSYKEQFCQTSELKISKINQITEHIKDFHAFTSLLSIFQIFYLYVSYFIILAIIYLTIRIYPVYGWKLKYKIAKSLQVQGDNIKEGLAQGIRKFAMSRSSSETEIERKSS